MEKAEKGFYVTTTLPYVNADPHLGHALEFVQADTIARFHRLAGRKVFLNTGTDEHGAKIYEKAREGRADPQAYADRYAARFQDLLSRLNVRYDSFLRTTDASHIHAAEEFWRRCEKNGDIYKKDYRVKYCVGCELEKTDSELIDGKCPDHPTLTIEVREEENYFFKFSKYKDKLLELYGERTNFVLPEVRMNEIRAFVSRGLTDFSISRLAAKMPWGAPVPGDPEHVMYVWFDALVSYLSAIGWPEDRYKEWWPVTQFAGKDNLRQQAAMWQAMLMSAGVEPSRRIIIHGFVTSGGQKMSKTLGNVADPLRIIEKYGADALRYYLLREVSTFEDGDFTEEHFIETYNANLANGLGNLVSRVMRMGVTHTVRIDVDHLLKNSYVSTYLEHYEIQKAIDEIWGRIGDLDKFIQTNEPFKKIKEKPEEAKKDIQYLMNEIYRIGHELEPFMPETAERIMKTVSGHQMPEPLFKRIE